MARIQIKKEEEIRVMREAGGIASTLLREVVARVVAGRTTRDLDEFAAGRIRAYRCRSAFLGYKGYPCHICISVNEEVVHGIACERVIDEGDLVSLDVGIVHRGFVGDNAATVAVGECSEADAVLLQVTRESLFEGIDQAREGNRVSDISAAIHQHVESRGLSVVREYTGHGVGRELHEEPQIPNFLDGRRTQELRAGMTLAIEPMVNQGTHAIRCLGDKWTVVTRDGRRSAHFEHTVLVTGDEPEILTCPENMPPLQEAERELRGHGKGIAG